MKKKDLKSPYSWEERHVSLSQDVLFVPDYYDAYEAYPFPGWQSEQLFGNILPLHIEYCSGNGDWIINRAQSNPQVNWIAVEKRFDRVRKIWCKAKRLQLGNLRIICGEALVSTKHYLLDKTVQEVYINFPDPWPKQRHAKNRLISEEFVCQLHRILKPEGHLTLVTDDYDYCTQMVTQLNSPRWLSGYPPPYYINECAEYGTSYFDALWKEKGKAIHYLWFKPLQEGE